jgi:hypothetical protein
MSLPESLSNGLKDLASVFERCVLDAVHVLETGARIASPFELQASAPGGQSLYCLLPASNGTHYAQLVVGLEEKELAGLFPEESEEARRKDAIGRLASDIARRFIAGREFESRFGALKSSTPFFSEGAFTAHKDWGLKGRIELKGIVISLQFSIRELDSSDS